MQIQETIDNFLSGKYRKLTNLNDTFNFGCKQCGECCCDNDEILVSPWDMVRMAEATQSTSLELLNSVVKFHLGENSHLPLATLKMIDIPNAKIKVCPFLIPDATSHKMKCGIQQNKPFNCAIFPLGRMTLIDKITNAVTMEYFCQDIACSADQSQTITLGDWVALYDLQGSEQSMRDFNDFMCQAGQIINLELLAEETDLGTSSEKKQAILDALTLSMYGSYLPHHTTDTAGEAKKMLDLSLHILQEVVKLEPGLVSLG